MRKIYVLKRTRWCVYTILLLNFKTISRTRIPYNYRTTIVYRYIDITRVRLRFSRKRVRDRT